MPVCRGIAVTHTRDGNDPARFWDCSQGDKCEAYRDLAGHMTVEDCRVFYAECPYCLASEDPTL